MADSSGRRTKRRTTLQDVAREAGVSPITVSRTLRNPQQVSESLRKSVRAAVRKLGYIPNRSASRLASANSHVICVIIPSLTNIVFADVIRAIDEVLLPQNYQVLIGNTHYSPVEEQNLIATFLEHNPDGMILTGIDQTDYSRELLENVGLPIVQIMEYSEQAIDMNVGFSHFEAGRDLTSHLIAQGRQRIGFIGAQMDPRTQRRFQGYRAALRQAGLEQDAATATSVAPSTVKLGGELLRDLLSREPALDAVFCCNDDLAMGAIFECQRCQIPVPGQLAVAGFNDLEPSRCINPSLTTVLTPRYEMGRRAANLLLKHLSGQTLTDSEKQVDLGYEVVVRNSA